MSRHTITSFIREHRHAFDEATPDAHGWKSIEQALIRLKTADRIEQSILFDRVLLDTEAPPPSVWAGIEHLLDTKDCNQLDDLACFIRNNRSALDTDVPDTKIWKTIESLVAAPVRTRPMSGVLPLRLSWSRILIRAAAAAVLLVSGIGIGVWYAKGQQPGTMAMSEVSSEYAELEQYYQREITNKQQKLANFAGYHPTEVGDDLRQMDQIMIELQRELANVPTGNREQVVRAMIENYEAKASVLRRVLEQLEKKDSLTPEDTNSKQHEIENL